MKFVINGNTYTAFDNLSFSPETDLTNNSLPINEFEARLFTNANIQFGQWAELRDDNNNLWARYWLRYAERIGRDDDRQTYIVRIIGQSPLAFLERVRMPAEFYNSTADGCINEILNYVGTIGQSGEIIDDNVIAQEFESIQIVGFAPEQSARERLQWILMAAGGYVLSYFDTTIHIRKISTSGATLIPITKTFWKPTITHRDYVTKIIVHAYSYTVGTPDTTDKYVTDGTNYWIQTETVIQLANSNAPSGAPENVVEIEGVTLISPSRASTVITNLAAYYFNRVEVDADVIDNAEYKPGDRVTVYTEEDQLYTGYIDHVGFSFGLQARGRLHLTGAQGVDGAKLTILYKWGNTQIASQVYYLPKGYAYSITTEYLDWSMSGHRYIFRPTTATVTGTLTADTTKTVSVEVALDYFSQASNERQLIEAQHTQLVSILNEIYNSESMQIAQAYKGKKKKAKRQMHQMQLDAAHNDQISKAQMAFSMMLEDVDSNENVLHVVSVDSVDYEDSVVYDPEDRTVVIDDGSSGGHDDPERIYLTSIEVVSQPVKLSYTYGEQLNLEGLSVKAYYSDNTSKTVTWACTFSPDNGATLTTAGVQNVTIAYVEKGIRKTTSFQISVAESQQVLLSSLSISSYPTKTSYDFNDQLDLTGVSVTAHYTDESTATVTGECTFTPANGSSLTSSGTQIISVAYTEGGITRTTSFNITVAAPPKSLSSIAVTTNPTVMSYTVGDTLDLTGIVVTATYSDNSTDDVTNICVFSPADGTTLQTAGTQAVTISYTENYVTKTASLNVSVAEYVSHTIPDNAYYKNSTITSFYDASAVAIGRTAFFSCPNLSVVSFPACLSIGEYAFEYCFALESASFPVCTTMDYGAFRACTSKLSEVNFPQLSVIPSEAFAYCYSLVSASFLNATIIKGMAFESCSRLEQVYFPELLEIWNEAFDGTAISQISLPKLISAGSGAFAYMSYLQEISLPNLEFVGTSAFKGCSVLSKVYLMNSSVVGCSNIGRDYFSYTPIVESSYLGYYGSIYVPQSLLTAYKSAIGWSAYSDRIVGI